MNERTHIRHRPERNIDTLGTVLGAHGLATRLDEIDIPRCGNVNPSGECGYEIREPNTERRVLQTEALPS